MSKNIEEPKIYYSEDEFQKMIEKLPEQSDPTLLEKAAGAINAKLNAIKEAAHQKALAEENRKRIEKMRLEEEQLAKSRRNGLREALYPKIKAISDSGIKIDNEILLAHILRLEEIICQYHDNGHVLRTQFEDLFEVAKTGLDKKEE